MKTTNKGKAAPHKHSTAKRPAIHLSPAITPTPKKETSTLDLEPQQATDSY